MSWRDRAACNDEDPELFFDWQREARAKAVCASCPVEASCLSFALATRQEHGVWGGLTDTERERILQTAVPTDDTEPLAAVTYTTRTRATGATCSAGRTANGGWGVVCESHGNRGRAPSRTAAENAVARPHDWCPDCRLIRGNKLPRIVG